MNLGDRIAVMSDIHGEHRLLARVLRHCEQAGVQSIVLLGDLFDRLDQAEMCAFHLADWNVAGVVGNHEREAVAERRDSGRPVNGSVGRLLERLGDSLVLEEAVFVHDEMDAFTVEPGQYRHSVIFAGHTHYRLARDDRGPLDISLGHIGLKPGRRYLINPGSVLDGQFAIWERDRSRVTFERVT